MKSQNYPLANYYYWLSILLPIGISLGRGVADTMFSLSAIIFTLDILIKRDFSLLKENWFIAAVTLWIYLLLRSIFAEFPLMALKKSLPFIRMPIFALSCIYLQIHKPDFKNKILKSSIIAVIFLTADGYIQYIFGKDLLGHPIADQGSFFRLTGPFSKLVLGSTITIISIPFLSLLVKNIQDRTKIISSALLIIAIYGIVFLSGERAALIQITTAIILLILIIIKNKNTILTGITVITTLALIAAYVFNLKSVIERQIFSILEIVKHYPNTPYGKLWNSGLNMGMKNWLFGVGPMHFETHCNQISDFCSYHPHNIYIELFSEAGIIGLMIMVSMLYLLALKIKNSSYTIIVIGTFIGITIKIMPLPSSGFFKNWYAVPLWFMIGWFLSVCVNQRSAE